MLSLGWLTFFWCIKQSEQRNATQQKNQTNLVKQSSSIARRYVGAAGAAGTVQSDSQPNHTIYDREKKEKKHMRASASVQVPTLRGTGSAWPWRHCPCWRAKKRVNPHNSSQKQKETSGTNRIRQSTQSWSDWTGRSWDKRCRRDTPRTRSDSTRDCTCLTPPPPKMRSKEKYTLAFEKKKRTHLVHRGREWKCPQAGRLRPANRPCMWTAAKRRRKDRFPVQQSSPTHTHRTWGRDKNRPGH